MKIHGTAKGGAVGKKDFGVAFSSGGGSITEYETTTYTNNDANDDAANNRQMIQPINSQPLVK